MASNTKKNKILLLFCDGTGQDGNIASMPGVPAEVASEAASNVRWATNVLKLSRAVLPRSQDGRLQIVFYQRGVGSETNFSGSSVGSLVNSAFGTAVASNIRDCYAFIAQNYEAGDEICLFGFSRGAYTVRKLAGLIDKIGLLQRTDLGHFFDIWKALMNGTDPHIPPDTRTTRIRCVGVWDTVGSIIMRDGNDLLSIKDTHLPASIDCALHALSLQENRKMFLPTLWTVPDEGLAATYGGAKQVFKQIWFPGAHSDVGGGYDTHELSDLALFWMTGEISSFINLDFPFLQQTISSTGYAHAWGAAPPHNAFADLPDLDIVRWIIGLETRLQSEQITAEGIFHASLAHALLSSPEINAKDMELPTMETLRGKFGDAWKPTYAPLNAFEEACKAAWGGASKTVPAPMRAPLLAPEPKFEASTELFEA
ncbi:hypothetical protein BDW22DRAFT_1432991 [Trametopsis cervina]|nr:hypothetical protein BDW22DRAFT_1432991 [Trametopsis cervina]